MIVHDEGYGCVQAGLRVIEFVCERQLVMGDNFQIYYSNGGLFCNSDTVLASMHGADHE